MWYVVLRIGKNKFTYKQLCVFSAGGCLPRLCHMSPILTQRQCRTSCHNKKKSTGGRGGLNLYPESYQKATVNANKAFHSVGVLTWWNQADISYKALKKRRLPLNGIFIWFDRAHTHFLGEYMWFLWWFCKGFRWLSNRGVISETAPPFS